MIHHDDIITHEGARFLVLFEHDGDAGPPWENGDFHGPVSDWTSRDKRPGEVVLHADRGSKRFYDFAEATRQAKAQGWGVSEEELNILRHRLGREPTRKEIVKRAVECDFKHLKGWCGGVWSYQTVIVHMVDANDEIIENPDYEQMMSGVEDGDNSYLEETAHELAGEILWRVMPEFEREMRKAAVE